MNLKVLGVFIAEWAVCCLLGYGLVCLLLPRRWERERLLLMPVFGAGGIILISSFLSYAGAGMRYAAPLIVTSGGILSAIVYFSTPPSSRALSGGPAFIYTHLLGFIAGAGAMASVVLFNAWNPYNDAFTYISIADYLQDHSFLTPAEPGAHYPVLTQMLLYQRVGLRMGSNFLLSFFAGLFRREYSFDVYMPTLALGLWLAVPGFWVFCRRGLFLSSPASGLAALFYGLNFSVPIANALFGFMPQTWGMVFLFPMIPLYLRATTDLDRKKMLIPAGLMGALLLLTYSEIFPFILAGIGTSYLYRVGFGNLRLKNGLISFFGSSLLAVLLAPVAAWKFPTAMAIQISAVVGADLKFRLLDYLSMMAGFRSFLQGKASGFLLLISILTSAVVLYAFIKGPRRTSRQVVLLSVIFILALGWFLLFVMNPWNPNERGQPWSTYKIVTYIFFLFAAMYGLGISLLWGKRGWIRLGAASLIAVYIAFFPFITFKVAGLNVTAIREFTGVKENPIAEYKRIRQVLSDLPAGTPVNLVFPPEAQKHRQMTAYFLRRPVIANWMDDVYIGRLLLPPYQSLPIDFSYPALSYKPFEPKRTVANLVLDRGPQIITLLGSGWYGEEHDAENWWRWLEKEGEILVSLPKESRIRLQGEIAVIGVPHRTLTVRVEGRPKLSLHRTLAQCWFTPLPPMELDLPSGSQKILLSADGPVARMGQDPRNVRVGVRNLSLVAVPN
jgi:hypothetical protein